MDRNEREEVVWVLVGKQPRKQHNPTKYIYYTGAEPAKRIKYAKQYKKWDDAKGVQRYAKTGGFYRPMKVTKKQIFQLTLKGK